jgi:hypothetical protein
VYPIHRGCIGNQMSLCEDSGRTGGTSGEVTEVCSILIWSRWGPCLSWQSDVRFLDLRRKSIVVAAPALATWILLRRSQNDENV